MKLNTSPANLAEISGGLGVTQFQMRANAKSFTILSNTLYSNKIRAIVRELGTNAFDSHVAAGCPEKPFQVHLPTMLEPWFAVRDFGVGLSSSDIEQIYTVYFESTKDTSNLFNGCLGLGSKSPFSYSTNFTVTSVKDGIRSLYSAFIDDTGCPAVARLFHGETREPNGVEVKFPVNTQDFNAFRYEAQVVYGVFSVRPEILGEPEFDSWYSPTVVYSNIVPGFDIIHDPNARRAPYTTSYAVMGNVAYPIDLPDSELKSLSDLEKSLLDYCRIEFETGEIDFQPSREGLSYIPLTVNAIKRKLSEAAAAFKPFIQQELLTIPDKWNRTRELSKKAKQSDAVRALIPQIVETGILLPHASVTYWNASIPVNALFPLVEQINRIHHTYSRRSREKTLSKRYELSGQSPIDILDNVVFFEKQQDRKDRARLTDWMISNDSITNFYEVTLKPGVSFSDFCSYLGNPPITTPDKWPDYTPRAIGRSSTTGFREYSSYNSDIISLTEREITEDTHYYLPTIDTALQFSLFTHPRVNMQTAVHRVLTSYLKSPLIGVNTKLIKRIKKLPNWISAEEAVRDFLLSNLEIVQSAFLSEIVQSRRIIEAATGVLYRALGDEFKNSACYKVNSILTLNSVRHSSEIVEIAKNICPEVEKQMQELNNTATKEIEQYPLLLPSLRHGSEELQDHMVEYVKLLSNK